MEFLTREQTLVYAPLQTVGVAGWLPADSWPAKLATGNPVLNIVKLINLRDDGRHWGWVRVAELLPWTGDADNHALLARAYPLASSGMDYNMIVALSTSVTQIPLRYLGEWPGRGDKFRIARRKRGVNFNVNKPNLYVAAGFAMDIVHAFKCAEAQGISKLDVRFDVRLEVIDDEGHKDDVAIVQGPDHKDLPIQPYYRYLQLQ